MPQDFKNSVAHLDVEVTTSVYVSANPGDNYYSFMYIPQGSIASLASDTAPRELTKETYEAVIDAITFSATDATNTARKQLAKANIASIFEYAPKAKGYIINYTKYDDFKYYAYWTYLEAEYALSTNVLGLKADAKTVFDYMDTHKDTLFSSFITDLAVVASSATTEAPAATVTDLIATFGEYSFKLGVFARGANTDYSWSADGASAVTVGPSPALYQLGRTLGTKNSTGTPIGNSFDTASCEFADVLPTRSTSTTMLENASALFISWCDTNKVAYFKTLGNGSAQVVCHGGWTIKGVSAMNGSAIVADWIVAYCNYMTKLRCAEIISELNVYKNNATYTKCLAAMSSVVRPFVNLGRVYNYTITAPSWAEASAMSDRETIYIPDAWEAWYADDARKVQIQGSLSV